jgi:hypothetical protein
VAPIDAADAVAYMYAIYPRSITTASDPSTTRSITSRAALSAYAYVAIWRQQSGRTARARAAADAAAQQIVSLGAASLVCSSRGSSGGVGALYAVSSRARSAQATLAHTASAPLASFSLAALMWAILGLICLWGIGMVIVVALGRARLSTSLAITLGIPVGSIAICIEMLVASWLGIPWSLPLLGLPWLLLVLLVAVMLRVRCAEALRSFQLRRSLKARFRPRRSGSTLALVLLGALVALVVGIAMYNLPYGDGFHFYFFKAKAFYLDHSVAPYYRAALHDPDTVLTIPAHPPLISLGVTWLYLWIRSVNEHVALLLWPALYLSALGLFYGAISEHFNGSAAAWLTIALAACAYPLTGNTAAGSYTDVPLAVFLLMGCLLLWRRLTAPTMNRELVIAGILLGALPLVKEEGLPLSIFAIASFVGWYSWKLGRQRLRESTHAACWLGLPWLLTAIPSLLIKVVYAPPEFLVAQHGRSFDALLTSLAASLIGFGGRAIFYWLPVLVLLVVVIITSLVKRSRPCPPLRTLFLLTIVCSQSLLDIVAMAVSPLEVNTEVQVTAYRLILQLTPLLVLASVDLWLALSRMAPRVRTGEPPSNHPSHVAQPAIAPP